MGSIKLKFFSIIISIIVFISLFLIMINKDVRASQADISIDGEPSYRLIKDIFQNNKIIGKIYEVNVTIVNRGSSISDELTVNLTDEEHFTLSRKIILNPGENKTISFNWSTLLIKNQRILITYYPSNLNIDWDQYNSGSKTFTIFMIEEDVKATSTPGFEMILILFSLLIFIFLLKKFNKP